MAANNNVPDGLIDGKASSKEVEVQWPLSHQLKFPKPQSDATLKDSQTSGSPQRWWHYYLYRNAKYQAPTVLFSTTKAESEANARKFLDEPVIGFDMEWPWDSESRTRLQDKVGLIQIASENKIALFHIGVHKGTTTDDLIAPSLRKIIESPDIVKVGVNIINADFSRLKKHFDLKPQAGFELSHLHHLVTYGGEQPGLITTKLAALAKQVQAHLGLPLWKGSARTSNWSLPLSGQQVTYAADDAYAGFMLYHCMNSKRVAMDPVPPLPVLADEYAKCKGQGLLLQAQEKGGSPISAQEFFKKPCEEEQSKETQANEEMEDPDLKVQKMAKVPTSHASKPDRLSPKKASKVARAEEAEEPKPLDALEKELFDRLKRHRIQLARNEKCSAFIIAYNSVLEDMARDRPTTEDQLLRIKGIGRIKIEKYGKDWIEIVTQFTTEKNMQPSQLAQSPQTQTPSQGSKRKMMVTPSQREEHGATTQLHTDLSFTMEQTTISSKYHSEDDSDSSAFGPPMEMPTEAQLKRRRVGISPRDASPTPSRPPPTVLSEGLQIFAKKLSALSKAVAAKLDPKPETPIVSEAVIRSIVIRPPRTNDELLRVPGILPFIRACIGAKLDLLEKITTWTPISPLGAD